MATRTRIGVDEPLPGEINKYIGGVQLHDGTQNTVVQTMVLEDPENLGQLSRVNASGELTVEEASAAAILSDTNALVVDAAAIEVLLGTIDADTGALVIDAAAIEVLLGTIDSDTDAIKTATEAIKTAIEATLTVDGTVAVTHAALTELAGAINASAEMDVNIKADALGLATSAKQLADGHEVEAVQVTAADLNMTEASAAAILSDTNALVVDAAASEVLLGTIDSDTDDIKTAAEAVQTAIELIDGAIIGDGEPDIDSITQVAINLGISANNVLASSAPNKQIWVYGYAYSCGTADNTTVSFQDEDDLALSGIMCHAQYGGASVAPSGNFSMPIWKLGTNKDLEVDIGGGDVDGWLLFAVVSV
jgi:hypothetical protein